MDQLNNVRPLVRTNMMVTPIGLGSWQFSKQNNMAGKFWPTLEDELINKVVSFSLEGGINWFDTAEVYGNGASPWQCCCCHTGSHQGTSCEGEYRSHVIPAFR